MKQKIDIPTVFKSDIQGVTLSAVLCTRKTNASLKIVEKKGQMVEQVLYPVIIRATYKKEKFERKTGVRLTYETYLAVVSSRSGSAIGIVKYRQIKPLFDAYVRKIEDMKRKGEFHITDLPNDLGDKKKPTCSDTFASLWLQFADGKPKFKTRDTYRQAYRGFFSANGARETFEGRQKVLTGRILDIKPQDVTDAMVDRWQNAMADGGNSNSTRSIYLRCFRALCRDLVARGFMEKLPTIEVPKSTRRTDDFLTVADILKLRDYRGGGKKFADFWIILYLCNGANLRDLATLEWGDDWAEELTFTREKTRSKSPSTVHIPITNLLEPYLKKYASAREKGQRVFPQILLEAKTEKAVNNRVHDFNAEIREGLIEICSRLQIPTASAAWARNSYITTLTWHGISNKFIDDQVGHTNGDVLAGYQGLISPKKRMRINSLLFTDPEYE